MRQLPKEMAPSTARTTRGSVAFAECASHASMEVTRNQKFSIASLISFVWETKIRLCPLNAVWDFIWGRRAKGME